MDGDRLDGLARAVATNGSSRRTVLRMLAATVGGWIVAGTSVSARAAQPATCQQDADCVDADAAPCTGGRCEGGTCTFTSVFCAPGFVCCANGECCSEESPESGACASDAECQDADADPCTGVRCEGGTCAPYILTCAAGFTCCGGECVADCPKGQGIDANCQCPGGTASPGGDTSTPSEPTGAGSAGSNAQPTRLPNTGVRPTTPTGGTPLSSLFAAAAAASAIWWRAVREKAVVPEVLDPGGPCR